MGIHHLMGNNSLDGIEGIVFTGGEPTARRDIFELINYARFLGFKVIQIQSNGRMFSYMDLCRFIVKAGATEFSPSVHGYNEKTHDFLTSAKGSPALYVIKHAKNQGVGGAIASGYMWCRDNDIDVAVVMAGDGQMDPDDLESIVQPVADGKVDYTKPSAQAQHISEELGIELV